MGTIPAIHHTLNNTGHVVNFSGNHDNGIHFLIADGSVHYLKENVDYDIFRWLGTRSGDHTLGEF